MCLRGREPTELKTRSVGGLGRRRTCSSRRQIPLYRCVRFIDQDTPLSMCIESTPIALSLVRISSLTSCLQLFSAPPPPVAVVVDLFDRDFSRQDVIGWIAGPFLDVVDDITSNFSISQFVLVLVCEHADELSGTPQLIRRMSVENIESPIRRSAGRISGSSNIGD